MLFSWLDQGNFKSKYPFLGAELHNMYIIDIMNNGLFDLVLSYLLSLTTVIVLPTTIWIISSSRIFCRFRSLNQDNFQERVRETIEETTIERISQILDNMFPQYGMTPARNAPFPRVIQHLLNGVEEGERLSYLANIYNSLVENGIQSPFFYQIVQVFIYMMGGGGIISGPTWPLMYYYQLKKDSWT